MKDLDAAVDEVFHLLVVPVAGVGDDDRRGVGDAGGLQLALGGVEHRLEVAEVRCGGHDLGGDDDLMLVGDGLGVVALNPTAHPVNEL